MIGQGAGRQEHRRLLAEQRRHSLFEFRDDPAARVTVDIDAALLGDLRQQPCIFRRIQAEPVGAELYDWIVAYRHGLSFRSGASSSRRQRQPYSCYASSIINI